MNSDAIREFLKCEPFVPFEIQMSNGEVRRIRHPEMVMLVGARAVVGYPETGRIAVLSLIHVNAIEFVPQNN